MANLVGTPVADIIDGTENGDEIYGNGGNDVIRGNEGHDWIRGNSGNDFITGNEGVDYVEAGEGDDFVFAGKDDDRADLIYGDVGDDALAGGAGADGILGGTGSDTLFGGDGADLLIQFGIPQGLNNLIEKVINDALPAGVVIDLPTTPTFPEILKALDDVSPLLTNPNVVELVIANVTNLIGDAVGALALGTGPFPVVGNPSNFNIAGAGPQGPLVADALSLIEEDGGVIWSGDGEDIAIGDNGDDVIGGGKDADVLVGLDGDDTIFGALGDDFIYGGAGKDVIYGGDNADWIAGGAGQDIIRNGAGNDTVGGGQNADLLFGGEGDDQLVGTADGFTGDFDVYYFTRADGNDTIGLIDLAGYGKDGVLGGGDDTFTIRGDADFVANGPLAEGPDTIDLSSFGLSSIAQLQFDLVDLDGVAGADGTRISHSGTPGWSVTVVGVIDNTPASWSDIIELEPENSVVIV